MRSHADTPTILRLGSTASTSDDARSILLDGSIAPPFVVVADRQTAGRGRGANAWHSDGGSLTFSLAIDPAAAGLRPDHGPRLALAAAVALVDALSAAIDPARLGIRWPNDVEADGRKLAGILPERVEAPGGARLVLGVGLNVSTRIEDAPAEVRRMATSVRLLRRPGPPEPAPADWLEPILARLSASLRSLAADDPALADRWASLDLLLGRPVRIDLGPRVVSGTGAGIAPDGGLRLMLDGELTTLYGGRVLRD